MWASGSFLARSGRQSGVLTAAISPADKILTGQVSTKVWADQTPHRRRELANSTQTTAHQNPRSPLRCVEPRCVEPKNRYYFNELAIVRILIESYWSRSCRDQETRRGAQ